MAENIKTTVEELRKLINVDNVIGSPIETEDKILIPVMRMGVGFGAGESLLGNEGNDVAGAAAGVEPISMVMIPKKGNDAEGVRVLDLSKGTETNKALSDLGLIITDLVKGYMGTMNEGEYVNEEEFIEPEFTTYDENEKEEKLKKVVPRIKYGSYSWNYSRLTLEYKYHFLMRMKAELMDAREKGNLDKDLFNEAQWKNVTRILDDSDGFFRDSCKAVMKGQESAADLIEEYVRLREIEKQYVVLKKNQESLQEKYDNLDKNHKELKKQVNRYLPNRMKRFLKRILKKIKFR